MSVAPVVVSSPSVTLETRDGEDDAGEYAGWYCVKTNPWPCPTEGCGFVALYMTAAHLIVVWPRRDDRDLLTQANAAAKAGRNPHVVEYEKAMGPPISWDAWVSRGQPTHGRAQRPDGWPDKYERL